MTKPKRISRATTAHLFRSAAVVLGSAAVLLCALFVSSAQGAAASPTPVAGAPASPSAVVRAFYQYHFTHEQCCFNEEGLKARRAWFTAALYERMLREVRRKVPEDEAPYFNGDPFTNSQEGPADFRLGRTRVRGARAAVSVTLRFTDGGRTVERRTLQIELVRQRDGWKIDNLRYPDGTDFVGQLDRDVSREQ